MPDHSLLEDSQQIIEKDRKCQKSPKSFTSLTQKMVAIDFFCLYNMHNYLLKGCMYSFGFNIHNNSYKRRFCANSITLINQVMKFDILCSN